MIRPILALPGVVLGLVLGHADAMLGRGGEMHGRGEAIVIRHDRPDSAYLELGRRYARGLVQLNLEAPGGPPDGHGTLIAPRWVLTAAHVAAEVEEGHELTVGSQSHAADVVILHPEWTGGATGDIALVRLATAVEGVRPIELYEGTDEVGRTIVVVGRGDTGTGLTGPIGNDRELRGATNRIVGANERLLWFEFNAPDEADATDLEGISGPGDSGNPAFLDVGGRVYLVGVGSSQSTSATGGREGVYGVTEYYVRVSSYAGWIHEVMGEGEASTSAARSPQRPGGAAQALEPRIVIAANAACHGAPSASSPAAFRYVIGDTFAPREQRDGDGDTWYLDPSRTATDFDGCWVRGSRTAEWSDRERAVPVRSGEEIRATLEGVTARGKDGLLDQVDAIVRTCATPRARFSGLSIKLGEGEDPAAARTVRCELTETSSGLAGTCRGHGERTPDDLSRRQLLAMVWPETPVPVSVTAGPEAPGPWEGVLSFDQWELPFQVVHERLGDERGRLVVRTELAWVVAYEWRRVDDAQALLSFGLAEYPPASAIDVSILQDALTALGSLGGWDREDDRDCENDPPGRASLFCLVADAVEEHMGTYHHRQPALEVLRQVIRERWPGRLSGHPLMDFNNHPDTTREDLRATLIDAIERCRAEAGSVR